MKAWFRNRDNLIFAGLTVVLFLFFALISHWTPVSGDDWVYAVGGMWNNPFVQAFKMYQTWSGRYLSELWGFLVAPHKRLWNILNPVFFTLIFLLLVQLSETKDRVISGLGALVLMLSVANKMRMQTYTWIMGTTYVIPLLLFLVQILLIKRWVFEGKLEKRSFFALCILNFCIPLYMENAAALICGADLLVLIYLFFTDRTKVKRMAVLFAIAFIGALIILLSPGASARLTGDNAAFNALSLGEKIAQNWPLLLDHTFTESRYVFGGVLLGASLWNLQKQKSPYFRYGFAVVALLVYLFNQPLVHFFWLIGFMVVIYLFEDDTQKKWYMIYLILCALGANVVMLVSPIFDTRSALYTVYMWILLALTLLGTVKVEKPAIRWSCAAVLGVLCAVRMFSYYDIYHLVHLINIRRAQQIEYYRLRPDAGDAWLLAYPDETIHSPNVEEGDDTHMYYFKEYYYLSQDLHLVFYYLEEYNAGTIFEVKE